MATEFKAGDVVVLKSGGPKMTVDDIDDIDGTVCCIWFEKNDQKSGKFKPVVLEKYTPSAPSVVHVGRR